MYRENKYGDKIDVEKYCCGSCQHYCFEREDDSNKCTEYGQYFWMNDSCSNHWVEANECRGGSTCFLTTCVCDYKGLPDDCYELERMRYIRDQFLMKSDTGKGIVKLYYKTAPAMVEKIKIHPNKDELLDWMYEVIKKIVKQIDACEYDEAISSYILLVLNTEEKLKKME